jgi:hypothetical protein
VTITGGHTTTVAFSVTYRTPGTVTGTITVVGIPSAVVVTSYTLLACPASAPLGQAGSSLECASEFSGASGFGFGAADRSEKIAADDSSRPPAGFSGEATAPFNVYKLTSLTAGKWLLYPGYQTTFGSFMDQTGTTVSVVAGQTTTRNLKVTYQKPSEGAIVGTVDVVGAPSNSFESGVQACTSAPTAGACQGEQETFTQGNGTYQFVLPPGTWWVSGFVEEFGDGFGESQITTAPQQVTVTAGKELTENFTVAAS